MKMWSGISRGLLLLFSSILWSLSAFAGKTVIFYSSIGMGHLSASRAIQEKIKATNPEAEVELKDIRDFMPKISRRIDEKLYFFVFKHLPATFDKAYRSAMQKGLEARELSDLKLSYNQEKIAQYLEATKPDTIIATHYGSAVVVSNIKESGRLQETKLAWVHTDYIEQFFPRISQKMDMTFLGHKELAERWQERGVNPEKVKVTGIPVRQLPEISEVNRSQVLQEVDLSAELPTFAMSGGSEGLRDYPAVVNSLAKTFNEPIQIVAICGKNTKALAALEKLAVTLPPHIKLKPLGFIPNKQLINLVTVADLYITKAGGLSPTEGAMMMKPLLLVNEYGGHEAENAEFFKRTGLAEIVNESKDVGDHALKLLANKEKMAQMQEAQREYRNSLNMASIVDFVNSPRKEKLEQFDLGLKGGTEIEGSTQTLAQLEKDFPAQVEVLLSYAKSKTGKYFGDGLESNPFGHIAIRIGNTVYTINHLASRADEPHFIHKSSLAEYLYSTKSYYKNEEFTGMQGQAYAKDTLAIRLNGFTEEDLKKMAAELAKIDSQWHAGQLSYSAKNCNCADVTLRILNAAGFEINRKNSNRMAKLPLDIFDAVLENAELNTRYTSSLVHYGYVKGSKNEYRVSGFPLSLYQIKRSFKNLFNKGRDSIESKVNARIQAPAADNRLQYEAIHYRRIMAPSRCERVFNL